MKVEDIAKEVLKYSPTIATALGGPFAGMIASLLATTFHVEPENLANTISSNPNSDFTLRQFELEHATALAKINATDYQTEVDDRESARNREIEIEKITGKRDWMLDFIALVVIVGFFLLCCMNYFIKLEDDHIITMLVGQISTGFVMVLSYYFGSSKKGN